MWNCLDVCCMLCKNSNFLKFVLPFQKPDIFEIFRKKNSRYLAKKKGGFPETYLGVFKSHNGTAVPLWLFAFFCDLCIQAARYRPTGNVPSTTCDVISFNGQGQLCRLTCAECRDRLNHSRMNTIQPRRLDKNEKKKKHVTL